jgi:prepilin-type N-terminal cleavage/methylation domain-containing protein
MLIPGCLEAVVIHKTDRQKETQTGFSMIELLVVVAIIVVVGGLTLPGMVQTWYDIQLRSTASEVTDLMQRSRMQAARANVSPGVPIRYRVTAGMQQVYADFNNNGAWDATEPIIDLPRVTAAAAAPNGGNGVPPAYVDTMDTTAGVPCDNTCTLAFSPRGLPCNLIGATCTTPAASYFVYYFQDNRPNGWAAVLVSKAGRTKTLLWNGTSWR